MRLLALKVRAYAGMQRRDDRSKPRHMYEVYWLALVVVGKARVHRQDDSADSSVDACTALDSSLTFCFCCSM